MRILPAAVAASALLLAGAPGAAMAGTSTVAIEGTELVVAGSPEKDRVGFGDPVVTAESPVTYRVSSLESRLAAGPGCRQRGEEAVECSRPDDAPVSLIRADMGAGDDAASQFTAADTPVSFQGGEGNDTLFGGAGADRLDGGPGLDFLQGDEGFHDPAGRRRPDDLIGGPGLDRVSYETHGGPSLAVTLDDRPDDGAPGEGDNVHADVETVQGATDVDNTLIGSDAPNILVGSGRPDTLIGGGGDDRLYSEGGPDRLDGGDGADELRGGRDGDEVVGGAGPDVLYGDAQHTDALASGADHVDARDGGPDQVFCGPGRDRASVDPADAPPAEGPETCERVEGLPEPVSPVPQLHGTFPVGFSQRTVRPSRRGRIVVRVRCGDLVGCTGSVWLGALKKVRVGRRWQSFALGRRKLAVPGGGSARLRFRLTRRQRAALRRVRSVQLIVRAVEIRPAQRDWTGSLRLRAR